MVKSEVFMAKLTPVLLYIGFAKKLTTTTVRFHMLIGSSFH